MTTQMTTTLMTATLMTDTNMTSVARLTRPSRRMPDDD
jgi:hypothetical protein